MTIGNNVRRGQDERTESWSVLRILPDGPLGPTREPSARSCCCAAVGAYRGAYLPPWGRCEPGGLVFLGVPESIYAIEAVKLNEPVVFPLPNQDGKLSAQAVPEIVKRLPQMDAVLIGCGLGQSEGTLAVVKAVLENAKCPVVLDADGIIVLAAHKDILRGRSGSTILTPHDGEFIRFGGSIGPDRMASAETYARQWNSIVLLKGHETCVTDGETGYIKPYRQSRHGHRRNGDVLAGLSLVCWAGDSTTGSDACGAWPPRAAGDLCLRSWPVRDAADGHAPASSVTTIIWRGHFEKGSRFAAPCVFAFGLFGGVQRDRKGNGPSLQASESRHLFL